MATTKKAKSKAKKKAPAKKPAAKKTAAPRKKTTVKKAAAKKSVAKKPAAKKTAVKKVAAKKPAAKPAVAKPASKPAIATPPAAKPAAVKPTPAKPPQPLQPAAKPWEPPKPVVTLSAVAVAPRGIPQSNAATPVVPDHSPLPGEEPVGVVTHYYNHLSVAVVHLDVGSLEVGDTVRIIGHTTDFRQKVDSLEVDHHSVAEVGRRKAFGMKVKEHVREHDVVYKVNEF